MQEAKQADAGELRSRERERERGASWLKLMELSRLKPRLISSDWMVKRAMSAMPT